MKKFILIGLVVLASGGLLVACDKKSKNGVPVNNNSNSESTVSSVSNSNSTSTSSSSSIQINQGQLEIFNPETESINDVAVLSFNTVFDTGENTQIDSLEICNSEKCWTIFDQSNKAQRQLRPTIQRLTANKSIQNLSSFSIPEEGIIVDRLKYSYKGKDGRIQLDDPISFEKSSMRDIYLNVGEEVSVALNSLSIAEGENTVFLPKLGLEKIFQNGVKLDVPEFASQQSGTVNVILLEANKEVPVNSYSVSFINVKKIEVVHEDTNNLFPKQFDKNISIFLPVHSSFEKSKYKLIINGEKVPYVIKTNDEKTYVFFETNKTGFNAIFTKKLSGLDI